MAWYYVLIVIAIVLIGLETQLQAISKTIKWLRSLKVKENNNGN